MWECRLPSSMTRLARSPRGLRVEHGLVQVQGVAQLDEADSLWVQVRWFKLTRATQSTTTCARVEGPSDHHSVHPTWDTMLPL